MAENGGRETGGLLVVGAITGIGLALLLRKGKAGLVLRPGNKLSPSVVSFDYNGPTQELYLYFAIRDPAEGVFGNGDAIRGF